MQLFTDKKCSLKKQDLLRKAYEAYENKEYDIALELFSNLLSAQPYNPTLWQALASTRQALGKLDLALEAWAMHAVLEPDHYLPHFYAGLCYLSLGNKESGIQALENALAKACPQPIIEKIQRLKESITHESVYP